MIARTTRSALFITMKINDTLQETYEALTGNKVRTGLTMLGIIIGIGSVIAMVSIGQGAQSSIEDRIASIGSNLIMVSPGAQRGVGTQISKGFGSAQTLKEKDADLIAAITDVVAVAPQVSNRYQITVAGANTNTQVIGTVADYASVRNVEINSGYFITDQNVKNLSKVAVIGPTTRDTLFGSSTDPIGKTIRINKIEFKVIGMTEAKGGTGSQSSDDIVYIPISTEQKFLSGSDYFAMINVQAKDAAAMTAVAADITSVLLASHGITDAAKADFTVMNQSDIIETASSVTDTFTLLLAAIAGISLIVGGIGIMNMMLTTVTERTREIGLRKAIGAKRKDISSQFLIESIVLTFIGGVIGVILGWVVAFGFSYFDIMTTKVSASSVFLAFGVSAVIGVVFGYYPARRASGFNPIEALRYE